MVHPALEIYQEELLQFIRGDFEIENLSHDCGFTEGPLWNNEGYYLFSDIEANCIYRITPGKIKTVFISNSGTTHPEDPLLNQTQCGSNGLGYGLDGRLLVCRHGSHDIAAYDGKSLIPYITTYNQMPFNSPNDLVIHSDGTIYFSDPPYGLKEGKPNTENFQPLAGVYCVRGEEVEIICDRYKYPNGVCLSPDEETLYICSNKPFEKFISKYDTVAHTLTGIFSEENSDGIECDRQGNVYLSNKDGILILNHEGERMGLIKLPSVPANHCWGGRDGNDLCITARENVFLIRDLQR